MCIGLYIICPTLFLNFYFLVRERVILEISSTVLEMSLALLILETLKLEQEFEEIFFFWPTLHI